MSKDNNIETVVLRGWGYGFITDNNEVISWYPCYEFDQKSNAIDECRKELQYLGKPLYVQEWQENETGERNPVGSMEFIQFDCTISVQENNNFKKPGSTIQRRTTSRKRRTTS